MNRRKVMTIFGIIYLVTVGVLLKEYTSAAVSTGNLTAMCLESSLPCLDVIAVDSEAGAQVKAKESDSEETTAQTAQQTQQKKDSSKQKTKSSGEPRVLIYHTHATESYLPSTAGNYHTTKEANTVREVGEILAQTLESEGIAVIHDKTIHDNPSYDASYDRSYEAVKAILKENPSIECIIDLHRDAIAGTADGPTETVNGKTCASYSYVLSNTTDTYASNKAFLQALNKVAASDYDGYTANILERPYWYNQELCDKAILIEMGNNRNHISDVRRCAEVFGQMLADVL